jgi:hypothetical protein
MRRPVKGRRRPRSGPERSSARIAPISVTPTELARVKALAEKLSIPCAELVRRALLGIRLPTAIPTLNRDAWVKLGPLAAALLRCEQAIDQGQAAPALLELIEQLRREVAALREELLGHDADHK